MITIETKRLNIREHIPEDLQDMHSLVSDDESMYFLAGIMTKSIEETELQLKEAISESKKEQNRKKYFFAVIDKKNDYIGEIGYSVISSNPHNEKTVSLGYFIQKRYWGNGFTTEAAKAVIEYAFTKGDVHKIETGCLKDNIASERIMIKCGFRKEAEKPDHVFLDGKWRDRVEYGLLKREYVKY